MNDVILSAQQVSKTFHRGWLSTSRNAKGVEALAGVSLDITRGEHLGILGQSGSGKTTLARVLLNLETPTTGVVKFEGKLLSKELNKQFRRTVQAVFQTRQVRLTHVCAWPTLFVNLCVLSKSMATTTAASTSCSRKST